MPTRFIKIYSWISKDSFRFLFFCTVYDLRNFIKNYKTRIKAQTIRFFMQNHYFQLLNKILEKMDINRCEVAVCLLGEFWTHFTNVLRAFIFCFSVVAKVQQQGHFEIFSFKKIDTKKLPTVLKISKISSRFPKLS